MTTLETDQTGKYLCYVTNQNILKVFGFETIKKIENFCFSKNLKKNVFKIFAKSWIKNKRIDHKKPILLSETLLIFLTYESNKIKIFKDKQKNGLKLNFKKKIISISNYKNKTYITVYSLIYVSDLFSGEIMKTFRIGYFFIKTNPKKIKASNNGAYLILTTDKIFFLDLKTGKLLKKIKLQNSSINMFGIVEKGILILGSKKCNSEIWKINKEVFNKLNFAFIDTKKSLHVKYILHIIESCYIVNFNRFGLRLLFLKDSIINVSTKKKSIFIKFIYNFDSFAIVKRSRMLLILCKYKEKILPILIKKNFLQKKISSKKFSKKNLKSISSSRISEFNLNFVDCINLNYYRFQNLSIKNKLKKFFNKVELWFKIEFRKRWWSKKENKKIIFLTKFATYNKCSERYLDGIRLFNSSNIFKLSDFLKKPIFDLLFNFMIKKIYSRTIDSFTFLLWIKESLHHRFLSTFQNEFLKNFLLCKQKIGQKLKNEKIFFDLSIQLSLVIVQIMCFKGLHKLS